MKIGYLPEGATDCAVITGLRDQLCPQAELIEGTFRGSTRNRARELRRACLELQEKGADVIVDLNDANELSWHQRRDQERQYALPEHLPLLVVGAPEPNVEMWLIADPTAFTGRTGLDCRPRPADAKPIVEQGFQITGYDKRVAEIATFVAEANLQAWERNDNSFGGFLQECRNMAHQLNCDLNT